MNLFIPEHQRGGTPEERFWAKVDKHGPKYRNLGRCWLWTAATGRGGYGVFTVVKGHVVKAHRFALEAALGRALAGMALHKCARPNCVRPTHLYEGDALLNAFDRRMHGHATICEQNGRALMTKLAVIALRSDAHAGVSYRQLVAKYGISLTQVGRIVRGVQWLF